MKIFSILCAFPVLLAGCGFSGVDTAGSLGTMSLGTPSLSSSYSASSSTWGSNSAGSSALDGGTQGANSTAPASPFSSAACDPQAYNKLFFAVIDKNHDGQITDRELYDAFSAGFFGSPQGGWQPGQIQRAVQQTIAKYDTDNDGSISEAEFLVQAPVPSDPEAYGRLLFAILDRNHDGQITEQDLYGAYSSGLFGSPAGGGWQPSQIEQMVQQTMAKLDTDHDGVLTYSEFKVGLPTCGN